MLYGIVLWSLKLVSRFSESAFDFFLKLQYT